MAALLAELDLDSLSEGNERRRASLPRRAFDRLSPLLIRQIDRPSGGRATSLKVLLSEVGLKVPD